MKQLIQNQFSLKFGKVSCFQLFYIPKRTTQFFCWRQPSRKPIYREINTPSCLSPNVLLCEGKLERLCVGVNVSRCNLWESVGCGNQWKSMQRVGVCVECESVRVDLGCGKGWSWWMYRLERFLIAHFLELSC